MFDFFKKKTTARLGLDLGTSAFKAVVLDKGENGWELKNYALLDLFLSSSARSLVNCEPSDTISEERLINLIKDFLKKGGFDTKETVVNVPVFSSFFTVISLPLMPQEELEAAIRYEAKKYVPLPLEEVELDWMLSGQGGLAEARFSGKQTRTTLSYQPLDILLVAVPKELIQRLLRIVNSLNLKLVALEAESFSLTRALQPQADILWHQQQKRLSSSGANQKTLPQSYLILDAGARSTSLMWLQANSLRLVHFVDYSGNRVTNFLSEKYRLSFSQIEAGKRSQSFLLQARSERDFLIEEEEVKQLTPIFEKVVSETKAVIDSVQRLTTANKNFNEPQFCLVSGGSVFLPGFLSYLENNLDMPIIQANPFLGLKTPSELEPILKGIGPLMGVAVGLALR